MTIQPNKIYKIKLKNREEFTAEAFQFTIHTIIFKDKSKKFEVKREDIKSHKLMKDLTDDKRRPVDRDHGIADRRGPMKSTYQRKELF